jgi:hypothetical protein
LEGIWISAWLEVKVRTTIYGNSKYEPSLSISVFDRVSCTVPQARLTQLSDSSELWNGSSEPLKTYFGSGTTLKTFFGQK